MLNLKIQLACYKTFLRKRMPGKYTIRINLVHSMLVTFHSGHLTPGRYSVFVLGVSWLDFIVNLTNFELPGERELQMKNSLQQIVL